ncbi:MAG: HRDC domain-containing protein, partial [Acidobacteriales bacterium]|nr:HRDC domain-containing protein [Terriglobales bacterium]
NRPPGSSGNSWKGKRRKLEELGFGFLVVFNGRLFAQITGNAIALGISDGQAAIASVQASPPYRESPLGQRLRHWRSEQARIRKVPAFRIFADRVLHAIVAQRPATIQDLLAIPGIGLSTVERYGLELCRLLHGDAAPE